MTSHLGKVNSSSFRANIKNGGLTWKEVGYLRRQQGLSFVGDSLVFLISIQTIILEPFLLHELILRGTGSISQLSAGPETCQSQ